MNAPQNNGNKTMAWLQELKSNTKTQAALVMFILVVGYLGYELFAPKTSSPARKQTNAPRNIIGQPLDDTQAAALQKLPNLAGLHKAGELPGENRMYRDLFVFDTPPPPPPPPPPPREAPPPKPPPTAEELAAAQRRAAMDREVRAQPASYKLIALLQGHTSPIKGAFLNGDDIDFFGIGDEVTTNWKLIVLNDEEAQFQNALFQELKYTIKAQSGAPGQTSGQSKQTTNYF